MPQVPKVGGYGQVGLLAAALGVGAAVVGAPGIAWAEPADTGTESLPGVAEQPTAPSEIADATAVSGSLNVANPYRDTLSFTVAGGPAEGTVTYRVIHDPALDRAPKTSDGFAHTPFAGSR